MLQSLESIIPPIPDPLHPFVVHFPVVLTILGALFAIIALVIRSKMLARACAFQLILAALAVQWAIHTGGEGAKAFLDAYPHASESFEQHTYWAQVLEYFSIGSAAIAVLAWLLCRQAGISIWMRLLNASCAVALLFVTAITAHFGGMMVYKDALGLEDAQVMAWESEETPAEAPSEISN